MDFLLEIGLREAGIWDYLMYFVESLFESVFGIFFYAYREYSWFGLIAAIVVAAIIFGLLSGKNEEGNKATDLFMCAMAVAGAILTEHNVWAFWTVVATIQQAMNKGRM